MNNEQAVARIQRLESLFRLIRSAANLAASFQTTFVFRPGDPNPTGNVYADWNALMARVAVIEGPKAIEFQNDFATPLVPAGTYDLEDVTLQGDFTNLGGGPILVNLASGVVFQNLHHLRWNVLLNSLSTTVPVITTDNNAIVIEYGAGIQNDAASTVPAIFVPVGANGPIILTLGGTIGQFGGAATVTVDAGATVFIGLGSFAGLANDVIVGAGSAQVVVFEQAAFVNTPANITQAGVGTLVVLIFDFANFVGFTGLVAGNWVAPPPTNVEDAINRIAAVLNANFGPIP